MLAGLPARLAHVRAVAAAARQIVTRSNLSDLVVSAAWLHDVGYGDSVAQTGFHSLDGARMLHAMDLPAELVSLVAYHSGAEFEAAERGLEADLQWFARPMQVNLDALTLADLTTSPLGAPVSVDERLAEILTRYSPTDPVHRAVVSSREYLEESASRARDRLELSDIGLGAVL